MCDRICGNCVNFTVLDDRPRDPCRWFGVCLNELKRDLDYGCETSETLDWVYDHGRHGDDDCESPGGWFKEDE